jgi:hypothetical protein
MMRTQHRAHDKRPNTAQLHRVSNSRLARAHVFFPPMKYF